MNNTIFTIFVVLAFFIFALVVFALFAIGFVIGYMIEEKRIFKRSKQKTNRIEQENQDQIKAKKEWKKFLEYDGSTPIGYE